MSKLYAPATDRNRGSLLKILKEHLPSQGLVLEVSSGTGQHAAYFAPRLTPLRWLPSEINESNLMSISAWRLEANCEALLAPIKLNVLTPQWSIESSPLRDSLNSLVNINMLHIAPWKCCEALFAGADRILPRVATLILYGPFKRTGTPTSPSNKAFDNQLRSENSEWGLRNLGSVIEIADHHNFACGEIIEMPANNLSVVFRRK